MKKVIMTIALLCALAQGAWAEDVNYIYYTVNSDGTTITRHTDGTASNPTVLTSGLISDNSEDRLYDGWYVLNSSFSYGERIVIYGDVKLILKNGCTLTAEQGIRINTDAKLTIYAQSEEVGTMGKLVAIETHHDKAAIGGNKNWEAGQLFIHGGEIEAKCNSGSKYAAGIGGGNKGNGGNLHFYGGTVDAKGGIDAAGIGGGNDANGGTITLDGGNITGSGEYRGSGIGGGANGSAGTITINGGTITAVAGSDETFRYNEADRHQEENIDEIVVYHIPSMMDNGADGEKDGTVTIKNGATVHLRTTNEFEDGYATGIGCANLTLGRNLKVRATMADGEPNDVSTAQRVNTCTMASRELDIEPCTEHVIEYKVTEQMHTAYCWLCAYTNSEAHSIIAPSNKCEKCDYDTGGTLCTLAFPQTSTADVSGYASAGFQAVHGNTISLLDCTKVPEGWTFVGWLKQSSLPASIEAGDDETLLQPGDKHTVEGNEIFYARYRRVFTETWQWSIGAGNVQAIVTVNDGSGQQVVATITYETVEATATTPAYTVYTATAIYKPNNTTYTFTDKRTVVNFTSVELGETDNTTTLADNSGAVVNVTLTGRTLYKDGDWNTICLPFDVALEGSALEGATLKELTDASFVGGTLTLNFAEATSIKAGQAYLIKWDSGSNLTPSDLVFTGVTLANNLCDDEISVDDSGTATVAFLGTYKQLSFDADDPTVLYVGADNQLYYPLSGATIGAQRAYFKLSGLTASPDPSKGGEASAIVLNFDGETTDIRPLSISPEGEGTEAFPREGLDGVWYSLDGRRLSSKPTARGIYINNGKKVVIK